MQAGIEMDIKMLGSSLNCKIDIKLILRIYYLFVYNIQFVWIATECDIHGMPPSIDSEGTTILATKPRTRGMYYIKYYIYYIDWIDCLFTIFDIDLSPAQSRAAMSTTMTKPNKNVFETAGMIKLKYVLFYVE